MRNGELLALKWEDLFIDWDSEDCSKDFIRVSRSYNKRNREFKVTKSGYWRNVPISHELKLLFISLKKEDELAGEYKEFVLPRFRDWERGYQSQILKKFLEEIGIKLINFHALRACFTCSLLLSGIPSAVVMKICGWKDLKTMEFYVRLAGVNEMGATANLSFLD